MKKLLCLLLALLMLPALLPARAEVGDIGAPITFADYGAALSTLSASNLNWELQWDETDRAEGYILGNLRNSPVLMLQGDYVAMAYVSFDLVGEDADALADMFLIVSTLVASTPAVARGEEVDAAVDAVFAELHPLFSNLTPASPAQMGLVDDNTCALMLSEEENGLRVSMLLLYEVPEGN